MRAGMKLSAILGAVVGLVVALYGSLPNPPPYAYPPQTSGGIRSQPLAAVSGLPALESPGQTPLLTLHGPLYSPPLVSIDTGTGKVTFGPGMTTDKASREFWRAVGQRVEDCKGGK